VQNLFSRLEALKPLTASIAWGTPMVASLSLGLATEWEETR